MGVKINNGTNSGLTQDSKPRFIARADTAANQLQTEKILRNAVVTALSALKILLDRIIVTSVCSKDNKVPPKAAPRFGSDDHPLKPSQASQKGLKYSYLGLFLLCSRSLIPHKFRPHSFFFIVYNQTVLEPIKIDCVRHDASVTVIEFCI